jgi:hypothetical protein
VFNAGYWRVPVFAGRYDNHFVERRGFDRGNQRGFRR